jgi:type II secretory pathway component PulM
VVQLDWQADGRVRITFGSVSFARLVGWLESVHREGGLYVQEATMSALVQPGLVRAELTLGH